MLSKSLKMGIKLGIFSEIFYVLLTDIMNRQPNRSSPFVTS